MDRLNRVVMYQKWHHLLFLHWPVDVNRLRELVPQQLDLDLWDGNAYLGLVLFTMTGVRPRFCPSLPFLSAFPEFNVRTYVKHKDKPGVWFFSLDAANSAVVTFAKSAYSLPYKHADMRVARERDRVDYFSRRYSDGAGISAAASISGEVHAASLGTLDYYLIERYRLYSLSSRGMLSLDVEHAPYPLRSVKNVNIEETLSSFAGVEVRGEPLAHFAESVCVNIGPLLCE